MLYKLILSLTFLITAVKCYEGPPNSDVLPPYSRISSPSSSSSSANRYASANANNAYQYGKQSSGQSLNVFGSATAATSLHASYNGANNGNGNRGRNGSGVGGSSSNVNAKVIKQAQNIDPDGSYFYEFEIDNGISVHEEGIPKQIGNNDIAMNVNGRFSYTAPEGQHISITYIADENGFRPQGDHLPTPPPIPEAIQRAIQYIQTHGGDASKNNLYKLLK